jgi:hypothetical protein
MVIKAVARSGLARYDTTVQVGVEATDAVCKDAYC